MARMLRPYKPRKVVGYSRVDAFKSKVQQSHAYGDDWPVISAYVRRRDNYRCRIADVTRGKRVCSNYFPPPFHGLLHAHHLKERSKGGTNHPKNVVTVCVVCHSWLHNKPLGQITQKQIYAAQRVR